MYNNNNDSHMLVNLPHILLSKIINYLDDNIDRICCSFVCRKWFNERERYLSFNTDRLFVTDMQDNDHFYLKSYQSLMSKSIDTKSKCSLIIGDNRFENDFHLTPQSFRTINGFSLYVYKLILCDQTTRNAFKDDHQKVESLLKMISNSNIVKFKGCPTIRFRLPTNLTSVTFSGYFDEPLLPGYLPPMLKRLYLGNGLKSNFNQPITAAVLPNTLEKLVLGYRFSHPLEPGVLPVSLRVLRINGTAFTYKPIVGTFPPNLEILEYSGYDSPIGDGVLPATLHTIEYIPLSWIPAVRSLPNIRSLTFWHWDFNEDFQTISLSDLPMTLTRLGVYSTTELAGSMPPSIKHLSLEGATYEVDEIFKDRSQYHLDFLKIDGQFEQSLASLDIKHLEIDHGANDEEQCHVAIPHGVESVRIELNVSAFNTPIPSTVKKFITSDSSNSLDGFEKLISPDIITDALEELVINYNSTIFPRKYSQYLSSISFSFPMHRIPNKLVLICRNHEKISIRRIHRNQFIIFGHSPNLSAIINESQIWNFISHHIKSNIHNPRIKVNNDSYHRSIRQQTLNLNHQIN
ncbi:hypothetical protein PPL_10887 [Heterostelium album PN500]|uniref:F-box domain-containing protein n=1 Tax=Heterostelium pallidum (strain ATCC 26659 / Pp 5 / PN500) TaxID=670386 RepID=D3BS95_HETP5|nr:hypothetical protein PPL_10887 [Heterostelium album PN500]EFA75832.1 hypothetical protein PPL_10887 [Heterostelium album PN500]|eukprot:XP_020427966.1 hypothetical protein PPL_10887 [Heterostelium album PN500]